MKALFKLVLRGSLVGAIAMATATGCGDDSSDGDGDGGEGNSGGSSAGTQNTSGSANEAGDTSNGGTTSTAGSTGGGEGGTTSEGGAGPDPFGGAPSEGGATYDGPAVAKFCNTLTFDPDGAGGAGGAGSAPAEPTTLRLEIGEGADMVSFTATTGECVPADGEACTEIPTGPAVLISLFDVDDDAEPLDFAPVEVLESEQWIIYTDVDGGQPIWNGGTLKPTFECSAIKYEDI
jgi:hypothetical protein